MLGGTHPYTFSYFSANALPPENPQTKQRHSILVTTHAAAQLLQDRNLGAKLEDLLTPCNCAKDSPRVCVKNDDGAQAG